MRKALVVGINYYEHLSPLFGCVNDAYAVHQVLERHMDGQLNFDVRLLSAVDKSNAIARKDLKEQIRLLFADDAEVALFYFAGHGYVEDDTGYLITSDCSDGDDGVALDDIMQMAHTSKAKNKIIILDSCHSGIAGNNRALGEKTLLSEGMTILTASSKDQYAQEQNGAGVFTNLFVDAMNGGAANLLGDITPRQRLRPHRSIVRRLAATPHL